MLTVYTFVRPKPEDCFDMSAVPLDELADAIVEIHSHRKTATLWFGYLDGWMLTPREEVLLRRVLRDFSCHAISHFPLSFSQSWKNEIDWVYTEEGNHGLSNPHHDGSALHDGSQARHGHSSAGTAAHRFHH
jgi:hypothetical protein